jgi:hypothetical protein
MIARVWTAHATPASANLYSHHFKTTVLPVLYATLGFAGVTILERGDAEAVQITVITQWHSMDAIRHFAGDHVDDAIVAEEARCLLTRWDRQVQHHEVTFCELPGQSQAVMTKASSTE